jgi:hypothetical protein
MSLAVSSIMLIDTVLAPALVEFSTISRICREISSNYFS